VKLGRHQEALEAEQQTLKAADAHLDLNPDDARAWYFSAGVLMRLGLRDQALERARRASMIDPEDPAVLYNVGCVYALEVVPKRRWIIWTRRSRMDLAIETGWRTIRIWIPFATSRGSKRCCESFDASMSAMQESASSSRDRPRFVHGRGRLFKAAGQ